MNQEREEIVVTMVCDGTREDVSADLRALLRRIERGDLHAMGGNPRFTIRASGASTSGEEPTSGRYFGVIADNDYSNEPRAMFADRKMAEAFARGEKVTLADADDDALGADYCVCRVDIVGSVWNSYDPDPHERVR